MFEHIEEMPADPILGVSEAFRRDTSPSKVNLGVGIYQDGSGKIPVLDCIRQAALKWLTEEDNKAYLPIEGVPLFNTETAKHLFGADSPVIKDKRLAIVQGVGGSGALRLGGEFIKNFLPKAKVHLSDPSWENHRMLITAIGITADTYAYYDPKTHLLDYPAMLASINKIPEGDVILLHVCCHNPTGIDLSKDQWREVLDVVKNRKLLPFFDFAYQGFGAGVEDDAWAIREFAKTGKPFLVANSFAKSFSLYRERVGALSIVTEEPGQVSKILSQVKRTVRTIYSSPPSYGAQLVGMVLASSELKQLWLKELEIMRLRLADVRVKFSKGLAERISNRDFSFIQKQRGMFSYSGLSKEVIHKLRDEYHIYALDSGRICVGALNDSNLDYVCDAINKAL